MKLTPEKRRQLFRWVKGFGVFLLVWQTLFFLMPLLPSPWPPFYWALPVHGQVVDADTGQPLAGVIVAAHWELRATGWTESPAGEVAVMEAVTDNDGRYVFRWWRPRWRWPSFGMLGSAGPGLLYFKSGYTPEQRTNDFFTHTTLGVIVHSEQDGAIIKLQKFQGTEKEYVEKVFWFDEQLEFAFRYRDCSWKKIPRMLIAMDQEGKRLKAKGVRTILGGVPSSLESRADGANERWCGSLNTYFRSYMQ